VKLRFLVSIGALAAVMGLGAALPSAVDAQTARTKTAARTPWGHPDLQGQWTNTTATRLERPDDLKDKTVFTEDELAEQNRQAAARVDQRPRPGDTGAYNNFWLERGDISRRTALLVDPSGKLPALTTQGQAWKAARDQARKTSPADGPESRNLYERCITRAMPGAMMPGFYNHNYQIFQTPGYVAIYVEMIHDARIIPLDGRPHVGSGIRQWLGDSRGRWEGDTLVVETTNMRNITASNDSSSLVFGTAGDKARVIERFTRVDADTIDYQVTVDDPVTYTKSWTASIPMSKLDGGLFEYACHEGNYAMPGILGGQRAQEAAAQKSTR
jgi:hypothetical protein